MGGKGWIGVDFDGTLVEYHGWKGPYHIGEPIPAMVERVKGWLAEGKAVKIFTARVWHDGSELRMMEATTAAAAIQRWLKKHVGTELDVTCQKDPGMIELWDDRAVSVKINTGELCYGQQNTSNHS